MKRGYKQTAVGAIPEDWAVTELQDLCGEPIAYGIVQCGPHIPDGVPYIRVSDMDAPELFVDNMLRTSTAIAAKFRRSTVKEGDLVYALRGKLGEVRVVRSEVAGANLTQGTARLSPNAKLSSDYFVWAMRNPRIVEQAEREAKGTTFIEITLADLRSLKVSLPPKPEQRAISEALNDVDGLLGGLDRLIAKKRNLKQAAMQKLLTAQSRLPGFRGEWVTEPLGSITEIKKGELITNATARDGNIPVIAGGREPAYFHDTANREGRSITISASGASAGYVARYNVPIFASDCSTIDQGKDFDFDFIYYCLLVRQQIIYNMQTGGAQPHVQPSDLAPLLVLLPPTKAEQTAIAKVLGEVDGELTALERRREKTRALKQAMMQQLLAGQTRLVVPANTNIIPVDFTTPAPTPVAAAPVQEKTHNWAINEAVVVAVLVKHFGSEDFPLGRKRCTKLSYLLHRHVEHVAQGYLKKAAGPYNPDVKYRGPEGIAQKNGYIRSHKSGNFSGFIAADKIVQAEAYFYKWYGLNALKWLSQLRFKANDDLERLATVDMAMEELRRSTSAVSLESVRGLIAAEPEWAPKLDRLAFSDAHIKTAIDQCRSLFPA